MEGFKPNKTESAPNTPEETAQAERNFKEQLYGLEKDIETADSKGIKLEEIGEIRKKYYELLPKIQAIVAAPGAALLALQAYTAHTAFQVGDMGMVLEAARDGVSMVLVTAGLVQIYSVFAHVFKERAEKQVLNS